MAKSFSMARAREGNTADMSCSVQIKSGKTSTKAKVLKKFKDIAKGVKNGKKGHKVKKPKSGSSIVYIPPPPSSAKQPTFSDSHIVNFLKWTKKKRDQRFHQVRTMMLKEIKAKGLTDSFYVFDIANVHERINIWRQLLPRVQLWYACKALDDDEVIKAVLGRGCGEDVATIHEFVKAIQLGGDPERLIFANPMKEEYQLEGAKKHNVKRMTFDCIEELHKIKNIFPKAECVMRIAVEVTTAFYNLSEKFGVFMKDVPALLQEAKKLDLNVVGVAFHCGSGGVTFPSYDCSIRNARKIFDMAKSMGMPEMIFLDIGGGFTLIHDDEVKNFPYVAPLIGQLLDELFPSPKTLIVAEPGRYISESVCYLMTRVIGSKRLDNGDRHYYINNGVYQGYMVKQFGEDMFNEPLDPDFEKTRKKYNTTVWGQTCDCCDWVYKNRMIPEMKTGEWFITRDHGAYQKDLSCTFNGFKLPTHRYIYKW